MAAVATVALFLLGVALGAAAVAVLAPRLRGGPAAPRRDDGTAPGRLTSAWSLAELPGRPTVLARDLLDVDVPAGARAVVSGRASLAVLRTCEVRRAAGVPVEAAVGAGGAGAGAAAEVGRAILFPGGVHRGALALVVADAALVARLAALADSAWSGAKPYVERRSLADLAGDPGLPVEAEGRVAQALPRPSPGVPGGVLLRLEDGPHSAAVHAARDDGLVGRRVRVQGRLARDSGGYPVVEADAVVALD